MALRPAARILGMLPTQSRMPAGVRSLLLSAAVFLAGGRAGATTHYSYWDGGDGDWSSSFDHWDGGERWNNNSEVILGGVPGTLTLRQDIKAKSIGFATSGYAVVGTYQLEVRDGIALSAGVAAAAIGAPMLIGGPHSWEVADAGAMLTVGSVNLNTFALSVGGAGDVTLTSGFTGLGSLAKSGSGTLWLTGASSHSGPTSVTDGILAVTGTATGSPITVGVEGRLVGTGAVGALTVATGGILSPGLSVGTLSAGNVTWQGGGYYNWQVADATGGPGVGHDELVSAGTLTIESGTLSRFKVNLWSLAGSLDGVAANFDPNSSYSWDIAAFASVIGFAADRFLIVRGPSEGTGGFQGANGGRFALSSDGARITLTYTPGAEPVWIDSTGDWSDGTRWLGGAPPSEGAALVFAGTGGVSTNDSHLSSVASLRFSASAAGAYVVTGSPLSLGYGGIMNESAFLQEVAMDLTLAANSLIVTHSATILVSGDIETAGHSLAVDGDHDTEIAGVVSGSGSVLKTDFGRLTLSAANTYTGGTEVLGGELIVNGGVIGSTLVRERGLLGGHGTLAGSVSVAGLLAPGSSPGVLTQSSGDLTLQAGARLVVELGGVTPGSGDGRHDRYEVLAGRCLVQLGVALDTRGWVDAGGADFLPGRGDVFTVLRASGGILGTFDDLTNLDRAHRILLDNSTDPAHSNRNLYGTGLSGAQTLAAYAASPNGAAVAAALELAAITPSPSSTLANPAGLIDSRFAPGRVVLAVLAGESIDAYSPEPYLGVQVQAQASLRAAVEGFLGRQRADQPDAWTFSYDEGHLAGKQTGGSSPDFDRDYSGSNRLLGATRDLGPDTTLGFFLGLSDARSSSLRSRIDLDGSFHGFSLAQRLPFARPSCLRACLAWSNLDFNAARDMLLGASGDGEIILSSATSVARDIPAETFSFQLRTEFQLAKGESHELTALAGLAHSRSSVGAFAESGNGSNLSVDIRPDKTTLAILGLGAAWIPHASTRLSLAAALEFELGDSGHRLDAEIAGEPFSVADHPGSPVTGMVGLSLVRHFQAGFSLQISAEYRMNPDFSGDRRLGLSLAKRF